MAKDPTKVRVALTGNVWYEPSLSATIVTDPTEPPTTTAVNLGYTTADGVTFSFSRETVDIDGWQTADPLRILVTNEPRSCSFTLRQTDRGTWLATMGGTVVESVPAAGGEPAVYRWEPTVGKLPEGMLFIDFEDVTSAGVTVVYRFGFRRAAQSETVEFNLVRTDAVNLPNNWRALQPATGKAMFMDTNDAAFAAA